MNQRAAVSLMIVLLAACWCALIVAAPLFRAAGWESMASPLYRLFQPVCHQLDARSFHIAGEPFAVCHRCTAIYGGGLLALIAVMFVPRCRLDRVPSRRWLLLLLPMVVDVACNDLGLHAATLGSRVVTGAIAGAVLPLFLLPPLFEAVHQLTHRSKPAGEH